MQQTQSDVAFEGTDEERHLAEQIFSLARFQGRFFATTAPIRLRRDELVDFIARQEKRRDHATLAKTIDAALRKNPGVFARSEADDGAVSYVTTRGGVAPVEELPDTAHTLAKRFLDPSEIAPAPPPKPTQRIADAWAQRPAEDGLLDELDTAGLEAVPAAPEPEVAEPVAGTEAVAEAEPAEPVPAAPAREPERPAARPAAVTLATVPAEELREALAARLEGDDRFASFGDQFYPEDLIDRYSRGDLRRIREFIQEEGEPLADETLLQTLFGRRPNDPAYRAARFSINYRLSREKRDFEFVGTRDSRLWATPTLPPIGTALRKASELGQDYRYLLDEPETPGASGPVTHTLSFFEWAYGLLPLDGALRRLVSPPYLEEQRAAVLRFEAPQLYVSFLAEVRYPTGNRGGYLVGLDEFYREYLVPGAVIAIDRAADNDGQFAIQYTQAAQREERVLQIDERRNRYVFRPQAIATQVDDPWLLSESRYPRLANARPLDDRERRRPEVVVGTAFERVAENVGTKAEPRYWSAPEELLPIVNVERPFSLRALREVLESPQFAQFSPDPDTEGAFFYAPPARAEGKAAGPAGKRGKRARAEEDEEEDALDFEEDEEE